MLNAAEHRQKPVCRDGVYLYVWCVPSLPNPSDNRCPREMIGSPSSKTVRILNRAGVT